MPSDNKLQPVRAIYLKMLLHRNMLPLLAALLLVGCEQEEQTPQSGAAETAGQAVTPAESRANALVNMTLHHVIKFILYINNIEPI